MTSCEPTVAPNPAAVHGPSRLSGALSGTAAMLMVGSSVGVSRSLVAAPLFAAQGVRYLAAAALLYLLARARGTTLVRPRGREWCWLGGVSVSGLVVFNVAVVRGTAHAEPAVIAVAVACVPVLLGVAGPLLEGHRPRTRVLLAAAVVTAGSALAAGTGRTDGAGIAWAALALLCEAGFTLLAVPVLPRLGPTGVSLHSVWIGAVLFVALGLGTEGPAALTRLDASDWAAVAYLVVIVTVAAFSCWYSAVARLGAGRAGLLTGIAPISAAVTGMITGAGIPAASVWLGMGVVGLGLLVGLSRSGITRRRPGPAAPPVATPATGPAGTRSRP